MSANEAPLWKAMLEAQKEIKHAIKDSKNPHLKNRYASLNSVIDEVKPILNKNGLVLTQHVTAAMAGHVGVVTRITHAESGEFTQDALPVPVKHKFNKDGTDVGPDAQELGSAITYGRRYGLLAMCAIASEDDDGESAVGGSNVAPSNGSGLQREPPTAPSGAGTQPAAKPISNEEKQQLGNKLNSALGWKPNK